MKNQIIYIIGGIILLISLALVISRKEGYASGTQPIPKDSAGNYLPIPDGYYIVSPGLMGPIPTGYAATPDKKSIYAISQAQAISQEQSSKGFAGSGTITNDICFNQMKYLGATTEASYNQLTHFDSNNYNVQYHDTADNISAANNYYDLSFQTTWVVDQCGNKVGIPYSPSQGSITYNTPGSYRFGPSTYVPNYEDSVYLSRTAGGIIDAPAHNSLLYDTSKKGICELYAHMPEALEEKCNALSADVCASTNCCVHLGGAKCVSGNKQGPFVKANYSDIFVKNKDYYFYNGKCYGNCEGNQGSPLTPPFSS